MLWVKSFHLIFMVTWFAGLFYLPRLFVYHVMSDDAASQARFKIMERKLYYGIATPGGLLTVGCGLWLWLHAKLILVAALIGYHLFCARLVYLFSHDRNQRSHVFYRWFNEVPVLILVAVIVLAVVKPL